MDYEVILTYPAKAQFDHVINYIICEFESEQAALSVLNDAEDTKSRLAHVAGSLKLCDDPKLRALGYRTIHFKHHKYFMLYRIEDGKAYVDGIYHDSQDYENIAR